MKRRQFLAASLATSALALAHEPVSAQATPASDCEFYLMRRYDLGRGQGLKLTESYFSGALIPALARMGLGPIAPSSLSTGSKRPLTICSFPARRLRPLQSWKSALPRMPSL